MVQNRISAVPSLLFFRMGRVGPKELIGQIYPVRNAGFPSWRLMGFMRRGQVSDSGVVFGCFGWMGWFSGIYFSARPPRGGMETGFWFRTDHVFLKGCAFILSARFLVLVWGWVSLPWYAFSGLSFLVCCLWFRDGAIIFYGYYGYWCYGFHVPRWEIPSVPAHPLLKGGRPEGATSFVAHRPLWCTWLWNNVLAFAIRDISGYETFLSLRLGRFWHFSLLLIGKYCFCLF